MLRRKGKEEQRSTAAEGKETTHEGSSLRSWKARDPEQSGQFALKRSMFSTEMTGKEGKISLDFNRFWK